ncbi:MAG: pyridoxine 5'-phosphate synthase [Flavobacteriales bacterium]|nr:pyridoxine 5'-phosphate synthase [Flavobacteriales bacterium]|tara:strand:+ start:3128 stop:3844 length:717 start_codon:yes stop_codon:yes gene_type:complete
MTKLSVNINKIATIRNARGGNIPNVIEAAINCERFGAEGITLHPRPDERHITYDDVRQIASIVTTEINIEGYPSESFIDLVLSVKPHQVTLVPDAPDVITSNAGWDTLAHLSFLKSIILEFKAVGIRTSLFVEAEPKYIVGAKETQTDRIELFTESYARQYVKLKEKAVKPFVESAILAKELGLGINAGHDLNLQNLKYFANSVPFLEEVSIGHALISDALYLGLEKTIHCYKNCLRK